MLSISFGVSSDSNRLNENKLGIKEGRLEAADGIIVITIITIIKEEHPGKDDMEP